MGWLEYVVFGIAFGAAFALVWTIARRRVARHK